MRESAGRKALLPDEEFEFLWKVVVSRAYDLNKYYERDRYDKVYFTNTMLFTGFGFQYGYFLKKANFKADDNIVQYVFSDIVYNALKANTVTRLCKRYNLRKNSLPKGILRSRSKYRPKQIINDDKLLPIWEQLEKQELEALECSSIPDAVKKGKYETLMNNIKMEFELKRYYNVQKYNVIQVTDFDLESIGRRFGYDSMERYDKLLQYQNHFKQVIFESVERSVMRRIEDTEDSYKIKLNTKQRELLKSYLDNMLDRKESVINTIEIKDYDWLEKIG